MEAGWAAAATETAARGAAGLVEAGRGEAEIGREWRKRIFVFLENLENLAGNGSAKEACVRVQMSFRHQAECSGLHPSRSLCPY